MAVVGSCVFLVESRVLAGDCHEIPPPRALPRGPPEVQIGVKLAGLYLGRGAGWSQLCACLLLPDSPPVRVWCLLVQCWPGGWPGRLHSPCPCTCNAVWGVSY